MNGFAGRKQQEDGGRLDGQLPNEAQRLAGG